VLALGADLAPNTHRDERAESESEGEGENREPDRDLGTRSRRTDDVEGAGGRKKHLRWHLVLIWHRTHTETSAL
jgi:hypothetical protein